MWYCDPFGDIQHMEPREILKHGKELDFSQCRLRRRDEKSVTKGVEEEKKHFD